MGATITSRRTGRRGAVSATLFLCLFASQAAMIAMSPVLVDAARDLHVSTAAAGQLRTVAGLAAGGTALVLGTVAVRAGLRRQLLVASALLALAAAASAAAPSFALLALAQVPVGIAVAVLTTAATLAAAEWAAPDDQARVLSVALVGQPAAWIVGMPLIGLLGEQSWRAGWIALPLVAAVAAATMVAARSDQPPAASRPARARAVLAEASLARWLASELLANAAWTGTLVYSGALFAESYATSAQLAGCLLAIAAVAYVAGNLAGRRLVGREPRRVLVVLALLLAVCDSLFGIARADAVTSTALFSLAAFVAGGRTLIASVFALSRPPALRPAAASLRAATIQFGYFAGSLLGGTALAFGGYDALGATMGLLFLGAAAAIAGRPSLRRAAGGRLPHVMLRFAPWPACESRRPSTPR
jgi:predicted MFS family arabinose efflux permease